MIGAEDVRTLFGKVLEALNLEPGHSPPDEFHKPRHYEDHPVEHRPWPDYRERARLGRIFDQYRAPAGELSPGLRGGDTLADGVHELAHSVDLGHARFLDVAAKPLFERNQHLNAAHGVEPEVELEIVTRPNACGMTGRVFTNNFECPLDFRFLEPGGFIRR